MYLCQIYTPVIKRLIDESRDKIKELTNILDILALGKTINIIQNGKIIIFDHKKIFSKVK